MLADIAPPAVPEPDHLARQQQKARLDALIRTQRRAVLVVNTHSRRGNRLFREAQAELARRGITLDAAYPVRNAERMPEIVREAIGRGHRFIILGGGDGSISSVVDHFAYTEAVFGLLPLGTANSFARSLGIPLDLPGAVGVLAEGKVADVDLIRINNDYFANGSSIGLPAAVGKATTPRLKRWFGRAAYVLVGAREFISFRPFRCTVRHDGRSEAFDAIEVRINNGAYQGGVEVVKHAGPDTGLIVIHALVGASKWTLPREWARLVLGAPFREAEHYTLSTRELVLETAPPMDIAIDGEVLTQTPARVSVAPNALMIMTPQAFADRR